MWIATQGTPHGFTPTTAYDILQEYFAQGGGQQTYNEMISYLDSYVNSHTGGEITEGSYSSIQDSIEQLLLSEFNSLGSGGNYYIAQGTYIGLSPDIIYFLAYSAVKEHTAAVEYIESLANSSLTPEQIQIMATEKTYNDYVLALWRGGGIYDGRSMFDPNFWGYAEEGSDPGTANPDGTAGPQLPLPPGPWDDDPEMRAVAQALWNGIVSAMGDSIGLGSGDVRNTLIDDFTEHWQHRWDPVGSFTDWTKTIFDAGVSLKDKVLDTWSFSYDSVSELMKSSAVIRAELGLGLANMSPSVGGWLIKSGVYGYLGGINVKLFGDNVHQIGDHIEEFKLSDIGTIIKYNWDNPTSVMVSYWDGAKSAGLSLIYATGTDNVIDKVDDAIDKVTGWFD